MVKKKKDFSFRLNPLWRKETASKEKTYHAPVFILIGILLSVGIAFAQQKIYGIVQSMPQQWSMTTPCFTASNNSP